RNLTPVYNISCTINAFKIVVDNYPDAILNIAGDGPEMSNLKLQAKQLGIEKNINFLGNLPNDKIPELFSKCSILINTPIIDNMPGSILEAYACGLAVVSTNVGGIPFIVNHGVTGMLSDSGDSNCLAKNIIYFIENKESAYEMISNARHFVENLSWGLVGKQWGELYNSLCQQIEKN
ncbi:MAG: glycosyltransferase, partial [Gammaproteobacteria bacterium]|nr:glycosyltransferase [Gammaproteobacteria bacterium]